VTVAGGGSQRAADGVIATQARLSGVGIAVAPDGSLIVTQSSSPTVWQVGADGVLHTLMDASDHAGMSPMGLAFDPAGNLYLTDPRGARSGSAPRRVR
jgi:glucose/arabinose dehydrogenase